MSWPVKRKRAATAGGKPNASGMRNVRALLTMLNRTMVGPIPKRRTAGATNAEPTRDPTPPSEIATPTLSGESPRSCSPYSAYSTPMKLPKK
jgi:hypothetical protein